jgi:hypothetical protein
MKHLMKNKQSKDMSDKKENKFDSKPLMIRRIKMIQSPGDIKENKDEEKSHSESEAAESKRQRCRRIRKDLECRF